MLNCKVVIIENTRIYLETLHCFPLNWIMGNKSLRFGNVYQFAVLNENVVFRQIEMADTRHNNNIPVLCSYRAEEAPVDQ